MSDSTTPRLDFAHRAPGGDWRKDPGLWANWLEAASIGPAEALAQDTVDYLSNLNFKHPPSEDELEAAQWKAIILRDLIRDALVVLEDMDRPLRST